MNENEIEFISTLGNKFTIHIDDFGEEITVFSEGSQVGSISLRLIEGDLPYQEDHYHITNLSLDACKKQGIGRRCLQFHKEIFRAPITAATNDGIRKDDGSHLTGDGPGFIEQMRMEGIVRRADESRHDCDDDF